MDAIAGLLDGPRARRAFLLRATMDPPWSLHVRDEAPLSLVAVLRGRACFVIDGHEPAWLERGDVAILRGPAHYLFADDPATPPQAIIHPGQRCTTPDGREIPQMRSFGVRRWGNSPDGSAELLTGTYNFEGEVSRRLLDALPLSLVLPSSGWQTPLLPLLAAEVLRDDIGQDAVLDRLLDLLLIDAVRTYLARADRDVPGWYRAQSDPLTAQALRLLQESPGEAWTLEALANRTRVSRATLARRFTEVVGQPPMEFLTHWRLTLAADLLLDPSQTLASVARAVGYSSPYALSIAFKRVRGITPRQHRTAARTDADGTASYETLGEHDLPLNPLGKGAYLPCSRRSPFPMGGSNGRPAPCWPALVSLRDVDCSPSALRASTPTPAGYSSGKDPRPLACCCC